MALPGFFFAVEPPLPQFVAACSEGLLASESSASEFCLETFRVQARSHRLALVL